VGARIPARRTATAIGSTGRTGLGERSSTESCAAGCEAELLRAAGCAAVRGSHSRLSVRNSAVGRKSEVHRAGRRSGRCGTVESSMAAARCAMGYGCHGQRIEEVGNNR
jgi:hypothetical protein